MRLKSVAAFGLFLLLSFASKPAVAAPILGGKLFYTGGNVTITTLPVTSGFVSELGLYDTSFNRIAFLTQDEPAGVTVTFNPGTLGIGIGQELLFGIRVQNFFISIEYFIGDASRNFDNVVHNITDGPKVLGSLGVGYEVGFEDLFGGGDLDFDDNRFFFAGAVTSPTVPEPASLGVLAVVLGGLRLARRRRK